MKRCLREPTLLAINAGEGTAAQHAHLRMCADCAERYDALAEDLTLIGSVLVQAPPPPRLSPVPGLLFRWAPLAAAAAVLLVAGLTVTRLLAPVPVTTGAASMPAFAADVSAALFATDDDAGTTAIGDAPDLQAALEIGMPCTQQRFLNGGCDDQVLALDLDYD